MAFGNIDYGTWMGNNPQAQGVVTEDIYNQALNHYGSMPSGNLAPNGTMFWGNDVSQQLGLPGGSYRSLAGSAHHRPSTQSQQGMGSIYVPGEVDQVARQQGVTGMHSGQLIGDYYNNAGVLDAMGSTNPADLGITQAPESQPSLFNAPMRSRTGARQEQIGDGTANQFAVNDFMTWFNNQGPRADGPLGSELNFPRARTYNTPYGESAVLPGNITQSFDPNLMQSNPGLFGAGVQTDQLMRGLPMYGDTLHGFVPPWVAASAGLDESNYLQGFYPPAPSLYDDNGYPIGATPGGLPQASYFGQNGYGAGAPGGSQFNPGTNAGGGGFGQGNGSGSGTGGANPNPFPSGGGSGGSGSGGSGTGGGGTTLPSLPGNPASPTYNDPNVSALSSGTGTGAVAANGAPSSASEWLAAGANDFGYLQGFAQDGQATNTMPAWQAMVEAQERNLDRRYADLQESFNVSGNRASTPFGQAAVDFQTQAGLEQNALLAQMTQQALEAATGRQFGAAGQLGQMAQQGIGQLSGQDFQSDMWQMQHAYDLAQQMYQGSVGAAQSLNDTAMRAATAMYGAETAAGMSETDRQMALMQMTLGGANDLSSLWMQNLGVGSTLGQQQYGIGQNDIDRVYQEWLRTRNYNSPLLPYQYAGATGYPVTAYPQQNQSQWPSILGSVAGPLSGLLGGIGGGGGNNSTTNLSGYFGGILG